MRVRYVYLGDRLTDSSLIGQPCDPILRADGKCLVGRKPRNQAVRFEDGRTVVVLARRLRLTQPSTADSDRQQRDGRPTMEAPVSLEGRDTDSGAAER